MAKSKRRKIVVFGCQQIAVDCLRYLSSRADVEISLVVTYETALDQTYGYSSVREFCWTKKILCLNPDAITEALAEKISGLNPDFIFSLYYRKKIPQSILNSAKEISLNIHPSLLPEYRGPVPTAWAIQNGETHFGLTIHVMDAGIDTGDILVQKKYPIAPDETGFELYNRAMRLGSGLFRDFFPKLLSGRYRAVKQKGYGSYYGKKSGRFTIDWQKKADEINNAVRVYAKPFNPAETRLLNRHVFINKARVIKDAKYPAQGTGKIVDILKGDKLVVSCADGCLLLDEYEVGPALASHEKKLFLKIGNRFSN